MRSEEEDAVASNAAVHHHASARYARDRGSRLARL